MVFSQWVVYSSNLFSGFRIIYYLYIIIVKIMHPTRIFKSQDDLEKAWNDFKEDLKQQSREWLRIQYVGKDGDRVAEPQKVPMTFEGFKRFCYKEYGNIEQYFVNKDNLYNDFVSICSRIKEEIRENQIIGGLLGFYNPSITQRLNNLTEKTEVKSSHIVVEIKEE